MRIWILTAFSLLIINSIVSAGSYQQTMAIQHAELYGEKVALPQADRDHFVSQGQEYLRNMVRHQMLDLMSRSWMNKAWFYIDQNSSLAGMEANVGSADQSTGLPISTMIRILADEDINHYIDRGWQLPIEIELESTYEMTNRMQFKAKLEAPFDDYLRLHLGSHMQWTSNMHAHIDYNLCARSNIYDGLTLGVGFNVREWYLNFKYDLTSDLAEMHRISIARSF